MRIGARFFASAAALLAVAQPAQARWLETTTDHFVIYGDLSDNEAAGYAMLLEHFDDLLRGVANVPRKIQSEADRVTVYVVPLNTVQSLARSSNIGGFYNSNAQSTIAVMPTSVPSYWDLGPYHVMFHEYTHHIFLSSTEASYPSWVQEGLAEFFGTITTKPDGSFVIGAPPQLRGWALHRQVQMNMTELLGSDGKKLSDSEVEDKYARGWLLTHYLLLSKKRPGQYDTYLRLVAKGVPSIEAGKQAFGDLRKLDGEIEIYNRAERFPTFIVPPKAVAASPRIRPLTACEIKILPTRIRSAVGVNEKTAPKLVPPARSVAADCPNDAFVQRSLAEVEFDAKNNSEAMAAADRALALDPKNLMAMVYKGRVYARQGKWVDARSWFIKANRLNPNYALPLELYYDTYARAAEAPTKNAVDALMRAVVLAPQDDQLRLRVAYELIREGDLPLARKVLAPVAFSAHAGSDNKALDVLNEIDKRSPAATVLAQATAAKWNELGKE
jgi:tetratricopeptide (TPR) repeat protein